MTAIAITASRSAKACTPTPAGRCPMRVSTRVYATYMDNDEELPRGLTRAQIAQDPDQVGRERDHRRQPQERPNGARRVQDDVAASMRTARCSSALRTKSNRCITRSSTCAARSGRRRAAARAAVLQPAHRYRSPQRWAAWSVTTLKLGDHDLLAGPQLWRHRSRGRQLPEPVRSPRLLHVPSDEHADSVEAFAMDRWALDRRVDARLRRASRRYQPRCRVGEREGRAQSERSIVVNPRLGRDLLARRVERAVRQREPPVRAAHDVRARGRRTRQRAAAGSDERHGRRGRHARRDWLTARGTRWHWDVSVYYAEIDDEILSVDDPDRAGHEPVGEHRLDAFTPASKR